MPGFPVLHHFLELAQIHVHWIGDAIQPSHLLLSPSHLAFNLSQHQGLSQWVGSSHQVAKVLELQFSISPSSEYSGLISFQIDWFDLLAVQGTLKNLLQPHSSKTLHGMGRDVGGGFRMGTTCTPMADVCWCMAKPIQYCKVKKKPTKTTALHHSAFFMVQLSHACMTTEKTIALTRQNFVGKVMSLPFNILSTLVIAFLPRSKHLLISWLQSPSAVILEPPQNKVCVTIVSPSICHEVMGLDAMILVFWMLA